MTTKKEIFHKLSALDISQFVEKKQNLDYLSWAAALHILQSLFTTVSYEAVPSLEPGRARTCVHPSGTGGEVRVMLEIDGNYHTEVFPIMNNRMQSKPMEEIDARDVSDSIKRALVKAAAHFGLGLSLYVKKGELPPADRVEYGLKPLAERLVLQREAIEEADSKPELRRLLSNMLKDERAELEAEVTKKAKGLS